MRYLSEESCDKRYDVVIVGGGPAGSTAAFILSRADLEVLLLDKSKFPRKKVCGGLLTHKSMKIIKQIFGCSAEKLQELEVIDDPRYRYRIEFHNKKIREFSLANPMYFTEREKYDTFFLEMSNEAGVDILLGEKVIDLQVKSNIIETKSGKIIKGDFIIGADGVNSIIREKIKTKFNRSKWENYLGAAIQGKLEKGCIEHNDHHILDFGFLNSGYGWIFPYKDHVKIGVGGLNKKQIRNVFNDFLDAKNVKGSLQEVKGSLIPFGCYISDPTFDNILLVGDAAGFMNPMTGEGIYYAHRSAELAASSIIEYVRNSSSSPAKRYRKKIQKNIVPEFKKLMIMRKILCSMTDEVQCVLLNIFSSLFGKQMNNIIQGKNFFYLNQDYH